MASLNDLPADQLAEIDSLVSYLQTEIPARCVAEGLVMRGSILDIVLTGSFANDLAIIDKQYANSDLDIIVVINSCGAMCDVIYTDGAAPEQTEDMEVIAEGEKHSFRTLTNLIRGLSKDFPQLDYAVNLAIKGYDNLFDSLDGSKIGVSLVDDTIFDTCQDLFTHHGISNA